MSFVLAAWDKLPVIIRAIIIGSVVAAVGEAPRNALIFANVKFAPVFPWAVVAMGIYLCLFWWYFGGHGWPARTAEIRRARLRQRLPSGRALRQALITAGFATIALRAALDVVRRLSTRPAQDLTSPEVLNRYPFVTVLSLLIMTAAIAGIVEEAAFRGYMQKPIEERHGPTVAILLVSVLFCAAHYRVEAPDAWPWLIFTPAYFATGVTLGMLAYLTNSIVIGVFVHATVDAVALLRYWWIGIPKSVWEVGFDSLFWTECAIVFVSGGATLCALRRLAARRHA
jgi:membrane protease YdiL (CAAX protease family)